MRRLLLLFSSLCCTAIMTAQLSDYVTGISNPVGMAQSGTTLFVNAVGTSKILKVDMTATNPVAEDYLNVSFPAKMLIIGNDMYFTSLTLGSVFKVDITATTPSVETVISGLSNSFGLAVKDNFIYVSLRTFENTGVIRFDYTQPNPTAETLISGLSGVINDIDIYGNDLYLARSNDGISKLDITESNPVLVDVIDALGVLEVAVKDDFLYYSNTYVSRINLLDATPSPEVLLSGITATWDLLFDGSDIFLAQQTDGKIAKLNTTFVDPTLSPDYDALVNLYNTTGGPDWTNSSNWLDPTVSLYSWHGVVTNENNKVEGLNFGGNNLTGNLPAEIGDLDQLNDFRVNFNMLTGDIPSSIYDLTNLETLWLNNNSFTGTISSGIGNFSNLTRLNLTENELTGNLPTELGNLINLTELRLRFNGFEGILPGSLGNLTNLETIDISLNSFEGDIPFNAPNANIFAVNNLYDFSDLEPFITANNYAFFQYSPQRTLDFAETITIPTTQNITFTVNDANINREMQNPAMNNEYQWFKDNAAIPGALSNTYVIADAQESDSGMYRCEITNTIVPDLIILRADITLIVDDELSIGETETNDFKIYPNPVNDWLTVDLGNQTNANITLHDISGKRILSQDMTSNIHVLDVNQLQSGMYLMTINSEGKSITKRFIKQ